MQYEQVLNYIIEHKNKIDIFCFQEVAGGISVYTGDWVFCGDFNIDDYQYMKRYFSSLYSINESQHITNTLNVSCHKIFNDNLSTKGLSVDQVWVSPSLKLSSNARVEKVDVSDHYPLIYDCESI